MCTIAGSVAQRRLMSRSHRAVSTLLHDPFREGMIFLTEYSEIKSWNSRKSKSILASCN